ncbi:membrane protein [Acetobacter malorum]|uniref:Membrane protein n=1 Tax=Acetobacter malorum TaxID=178901 RepID=A0A1Y3G507_9PROT|nr:membrane protein [Acetobacter malorum]
MLCGGAASAHAADSSFSPAQRAEIVEIVRNALKTDPTILSDAISSLQTQAAARKASSALETVRHNKAQYGESTTDVVLGNKNGKLEVVEFYDPRCQYCRKVLGDVDHLIGSEPDLRLVEKVIPVLGPNSVIDAEAIMAAGLQGKYVPFQKALMTDSSAPSLDRIRRLAQNVGLDADRLLKDMKSPAVTTALSKNLELAKAIDLEGTPTFIIGDREIIPGAASESDLKAALDRLRKAR